MPVYRARFEPARPVRDDCGMHTMRFEAQAAHLVYTLGLGKERRRNSELSIPARVVPRFLGS